MADKTPIKAVFNATNVATGLAEFETSDTIGLTDGGLGVSLSIGTASQVLLVNSGGTAVVDHQVLKKSYPNRILGIYFTSLEL